MMMYLVTSLIVIIKGILLPIKEIKADMEILIIIQDIQGVLMRAE